MAELNAAAAWSLSAPEAVPNLASTGAQATRLAGRSTRRHCFLPTENAARGMRRPAREECLDEVLRMMPELEKYELDTDGM